MVNDMSRAKQYCLFLSVLVIYEREKNLTFKICAPDFSAHSKTKLCAKIKGVRAISLFDFPKTWQVCGLRDITSFSQYFSHPVTMGQ